VSSARSHLEENSTPSWSESSRGYTTFPATIMWLRVVRGGVYLEPGASRFAFNFTTLSR
jgi:hypothetical protein